MEKKFYNFLLLPVVFNVRLMPFFYFSQFFNLFQVKGYKKKRLKKFSNHHAIKTLHKIQADLITSIISAFFSHNAQLVAEQFSIGINRTRKQRQFVYWFIAVLKYYQVFGANMQALKLILFGKLGGKMRTQHLKYSFGVPTIRNNTYALKVSYGFSSAETYSGTFGVHIWIYQSDAIILTKFFGKYTPELW